MTENTSVYSVIEPTRQAFLRDLKTGRYQPGERLPGERELARHYGIGRSSMVKVLHLLEKDRYVERIPVYGTFVRQDINSRVEPLKLAVASLDRPLESGSHDPFSWEASSEVMRGMIGESTLHKGVSLSWYFCQETSNTADFRRQIEDLSEFDGVIFSGCGMEEHKKELLRRDIPGVVICPKLLYKREIFPVIDYDRWSIFPDYCRILAEKYHNRPVILINRPAAPCDEIESGRINAFFTEGFQNLGIDVEKVNLPQADGQDFHHFLEQLKAHQMQLQLDRAPLLLALSRVLLPPLCALIRESNSQAVPAGFIGGNTIEQLHAGISHWQEPFFDMGRTAVAMLTEYLREKTVLQDKILSMTYRDV